MANTITHKKSSTAGNIPEPADLAYAEIAINYEDGILYIKKNNNTIVSYKSVEDFKISDLSDFVVFEATDRTGVADVTSELSTFIESNPQTYVFIPPGTYRINDLDVDTSLLLFAFPGTATFIHDSGSSCISYNGSNHASHPAMQDISAISKVASPWTSYVSRLTVEDASLYSVSDKIFVSSNNDINSNGWAIGEGASVLGVDTGNEYVYVDRVLEFNDDYTTSPKIIKYDMTRKIHINGIYFTSNGDYSDDSITVRSDTIDIRGQQDVLIENCYFYETWKAAIVAWTINGMHVRDCKFRDIPDIDIALTQTYGNCIVIAGGCHDVLVETCSANVCRHMITTSGKTSVNGTYVEAEWFVYGVPTYCTFKDLECQNSTGTAFDTREEGKALIFKDCTVKWTTRGSGSQDSGGTGIYIRAMDTTIENFTQIGGDTGIRFACTDFGRKFFYNVRGATIKNLYTSNDTDTALLIDNQTGVAVEDRAKISISGFKAERTANVIQVSADSQVDIDDVEARNFKYFTKLSGGAKILCHKSNLDYSESTFTGTLYCVNFTGTAAKTSEAIMKDMFVVKGDTASRPAAIFSTSDTNGTKEYFISSFTEYNPDSVTKTGVITPNTSLRQSSKASTRSYKMETAEMTDTTYSIVSKDWGNVIETTNSSDVTITLSVDAPADTAIAVIQDGLGQVEFVAASGATLFNRSGHTKIAGRYGMVTLYVKANTDGQSAEWVLSGDTSD